VPIVRHGTKITAYLPDGDVEAPVFLAKRRILANERGAAPERQFEPERRDLVYA
jgi:hypothetical protein